MMEDGNLIRFIIALLFSLPLFLVVLSGPIVDWLSAREKRKKAAAAAKAAAADGTAAGAAVSSTVAPSAPSSTPEPA